jgi:hypothetical protein
LLDKLERGRIGHGEAMRWLGVDSYNQLVSVAPETRSLLR